MLLRLLVVLILYSSYVWFFLLLGRGVAPSAPLHPRSVPTRWPSQRLVVHVSCMVNTAPWKIFVKTFSYIMEPKTQSPITLVIVDS